MGKPRGRRRLLKPKGWRIKTQSETQKSIAEAE